MTEKLKFIQFGLGPIGIRTARFLMERENLELVGAIDIDPKKVGRDAGEILLSDNPLGVKVCADAEQVLGSCDAELVVLSTLSSFADLEEQLMLCIRHRKNVISSCEEMAFPWVEDPERSERINTAAQKAGVTLLATGVNPGFAMDALPIFLSSVCRQVSAVRVERHQDAALRRLPFQQKIGAGLSLQEFQRKVDDKVIRHVGFTQSIQMIASALGWKLDRVVDIVCPAIADKDLESPYLKVNQGAVAGVLQTATGYQGENPVITIELQAFLGHPDPKDAILIEGENPIYSEVRGGFNGDIATCAIIANSAQAVLSAEAGLKTMLDIGLTSWFQGYHKR